jgi:hypothetical protein
MTEAQTAAPDDTGGKQKDTRFKPGQSGNPAGRPKGARSKLSDDFFKALAEDFGTHGIAAIVAMRSERPGEYAKMIAGLMTKEVTGEDGAPLFPTEIRQTIVKPPVG